MLIRVTKEEYKIIEELRRTKHYENDYIFYDDYAEIILRDRKGKDKFRAKISLEDVEKCKNYNWYASGDRYVSCHELNQVTLHRYLLDAPKNILVDHINNDGFDCRRENIRLCTAQQNGFNNPNAIGVSQDKRNGKWRAYISVNRKQINLGYYNTKEEAIQARIDGEKQYFGDFSPRR